jgi:hypothetical protein
MTSRAENQAASVVSSIPWGDRTRLLPKATAYAFSIDLSLQSTGPYLTFREQRQPEGGLRHLFGQSMVLMPGGVACEVPTGTIFAANGEIGDPGDPSSNWLKLQIQAGIGELGQDGDLGRYPTTLSFSCTGVLELVGDPGAYRRRSGQLSGSAFVACIQESSTANYRWLERRQLFGIGRVSGESRNPEGKSGSVNGWNLSFSFDLYGAE